MALDAMGRWMVTQSILYVEEGRYTLDDVLNTLRGQGYYQVAAAVVAHFDAS